MWELVDVPNGTITNGELITLYNLLTCFVNDEQKELAKKLKPMYDIAIADKIAKNTWADEGGNIPEV